MAELRSVVRLHIPGHGSPSVAEIEAAPGMLDALPPERRSLMSGLLVLTDEANYIIVNDRLGDISGYFFEELPKLLEAGESAEFRTPDGDEYSFSVTGDEVTLSDDEDAVIETSLAVLLKALDAAGDQFSRLKTLLD